ncbi:MAG: beta-xylosidase, partial [Blastochloris sp.]|nr:beta-xylosidase [Blastochloris sp.]
FSHMTHEELVNWILCALLYVHRSGDKLWLKKNLSIFQRCLSSMMNRDHPEPALRNGIMGLDSSRCAGGSEITTYDSLDTSLGQARNNLYLAVKSWACYVGLEALFQKVGRSKAARDCHQQAARACTTLSAALNPQGYIPAVIGEGVDSQIIPAVEGLVFPHLLGLPQALSEDGPYTPLIRALKTHTRTVLQPGACLFPDGGLKLSSSSNNSWLSKIYLCQFVIREVLRLPCASLMTQADRAHVAWLLHPQESYWAWSDQMISGVASGSKYYPRGVTAILWLQESKKNKILITKPPDFPLRSPPGDLT